MFAALATLTTFATLMAPMRVAASTAQPATTLPLPSVQTPVVVATYPRDPTCFTEGLQWTGQGFLQSCGIYGQSQIEESALDGTVRRRTPIPAVYFGEGLTLLGTTIYQLTWREGVVLLHDARSFADLGRRRLPAGIMEGWGLTTDGKRLIASDGTSTIRWLDRATLKVVRSITVRSGANEVNQLNELEYINGELWANVWQTNLIMRIDPATGRVRSILDLSALRPTQTRADPDSVLNGIAYDPTTKRVYVTGKRWPSVFQIRIPA